MGPVEAFKQFDKKLEGWPSDLLSFILIVFAVVVIIIALTVRSTSIKALMLAYFFFP